MPINISMSNSDGASYEWSPSTRWAHFKPLLYDRLQIRHGIYPAVPDIYPVLMKPVINLEGLSLGVQFAANEEKIASLPGYLWMPIFTGQHTSVDVTVYNGEVTDWEAVRGEPLDGFLGAFDYWEAIGLSAREYRQILKVVERLDIGNGTINIEMIGGQVIEAHLRPSESAHMFGRFRYAKPVLTERRVKIRPDELLRFYAGIKGVEAIARVDEYGDPERHGSGLWRYAELFGDDLDQLRLAAAEGDLGL